MRLFILLLICILICPCPILAQDVEEDNDTVTITRQEFEDLKSAVEELRQQVEDMKTERDAKTVLVGESAPPGEEEPAAQAEPVPSASGGGRALQLPDISLVGIAKGKVSSDERDEARDRLRLSEVEIGIQSYVFPNVKADAFIAMSPEEDEAAQAEEAYLTYLGLGEGTNLYIGRRFVPFGRTNVIHGHSWPYVRRPLAFRNLVSEEALAGEGASASYLVPAGSKLFVQADLGVWTGEGPGESSELSEIVAGPGASFADRFTTARLWSGYPVTQDSELEIGGSYAYGRSKLVDDESLPAVRLTGLDLSYRLFSEGDKRLLLRGEGFQRRESGEVGRSTSKGYYLFGDYRWDRYNSLGLLYDWSEFPQATDQHESALSLIYTKQFSERYYLRLQGTRGSRPGDDSYNEAWLQFVWGVGPHTHNLE